VAKRGEGPTEEEDLELAKDKLGKRCSDREWEKVAGAPPIRVV